MRKVMYAVLVCAVAAVMTGCSSHPATPRGVAEKSLECAISKDFKGFYDCYYFPEDRQDEKKERIKMTEEIMDKNAEEASNEMPTSYKFVSEDVDEEKDRASVTFEITFGNGRTKEQTVWLKKEKDGKWYIRD